MGGPWVPPGIPGGPMGVSLGCPRAHGGSRGAAWRSSGALDEAQGALVGPEGPPHAFLEALLAHRGGVAKSVGPPGGGHFGAPVRRKVIKNSWKYVYLSEMGFSGGSQHGRRKEQDGLARLRFPGGVQIKARGQKGPPEALSGRPKGPRDIDKMGSGNWPPQNVCFSSGFTVFPKNHQNAPGGDPGCFFRVNLEPREGPGPPPGDF